MRDLTLAALFGVAITAFAAPFGAIAGADDAHLSIATPEGHAPISVMADHRHKAGEFMVSLRQMNMKMRGNIKGTDELSDAQVLAEPNEYGSPANLRVVPQEMDMNMTMLGAMYAPSDKVTLLAMLMQIDNEMTLTTYRACRPPICRSVIWICFLMKTLSMPAS